MNFKSQKGYSLLEIGVGLILITIFMISGVTMLKATYNTYRYIEQQNIVMNYLIKSVEKELLDKTTFEISNDPDNTVVTEDGITRKVTVTTIKEHNLIITTTVENLPSKNGKDYSDSLVRLVTSDAEFFMRKGDQTSKRTLTLKTLKIGGRELGT